MCRGPAGPSHSTESDWNIRDVSGIGPGILKNQNQRGGGGVFFYKHILCAAPPAVLILDYFYRYQNRGRGLVWNITLNLNGTTLAHTMGYIYKPGTFKNKYMPLIVTFYWYPSD